MNTLICKNCGHSKIYAGTDSYDERCEICGKQMTLQIENETLEIEKLVSEDEEGNLEFEKGIKSPYTLPKKDYYTLEEVIEIDLIKGIEDNIKSIGHKRTWECIEHIKNAKQRTVFRRGFLKAQGQIPKTDLRELGI